MRSLGRRNRPLHLTSWLVPWYWDPELGRGQLDRRQDRRLRYGRIMIHGLLTNRLIEFLQLVPNNTFFRIGIRDPPYNLQSSRTSDCFTEMRCHCSRATILSPVSCLPHYVPLQSPGTNRISFNTCEYQHYPDPAAKQGHTNFSGPEQPQLSSGQSKG